MAMPKSRSTARRRMESTQFFWRSQHRAEAPIRNEKQHSLCYYGIHTCADTSRTYMYICIYICTPDFFYLSVYQPIYLSIYLSLYIYKYLYLSMYLFTYVHVYYALFSLAHTEFPGRGGGSHGNWRLPLFATGTEREGGREGERLERKTQRERERASHTFVYIHVYTLICTNVCTGRRFRLKKSKAGRQTCRSDCAPLHAGFFFQEEVQAALKSVVPQAYVLNVV